MSSEMVTETYSAVIYNKIPYIIKLSDFGLARNNNVLNDSKNTPTYASPLQTIHFHDEKADKWAFFISFLVAINKYDYISYDVILAQIYNFDLKTINHPKVYINQVFHYMKNHANENLICFHQNYITKVVSSAINEYNYRILRENICEIKSTKASDYYKDLDKYAILTRERDILTKNYRRYDESCLKNFQIEYVTELKNIFSHCTIGIPYDSEKYTPTEGKCRTENDRETGKLIVSDTDIKLNCGKLCEEYRGAKGEKCTAYAQNKKGKWCELYIAVDSTGRGFQKNEKYNNVYCFVRNTTEEENNNKLPNFLNE